MSSSDPLDDLRARFIYTAERRDRWRVMDEALTPLRGDCEDWALTALWMLTGRSMWCFWWWVISFRALIWYCHTAAGDGHACLWVRGRGWIDNIYPEFGPLQHILIYPYVAPMLALNLLIKR